MKDSNFTLSSHAYIFPSTFWRKCMKPFSGQWSPLKWPINGKSSFGTVLKFDRLSEEIEFIRYLLEIFFVQIS